MNYAELAGSGSGFLLLTPSFAQPLDRDGRPSAEARPHSLTFRPTDLDWAGDRYMAASGDSMSAFSPDGEVLLPPVALPVMMPAMAWNGSRGLIVGKRTSGGESMFMAVPASSDGTLGEPLFLGGVGAEGRIKGGRYAVAPFGAGFLVAILLDQINVVAAIRFDASGKIVGDVQRVAAVDAAENVQIAVHGSGAIVSFRSYLDLLTTVPIRPDGSPGAPGLRKSPVSAYQIVPTPAGALLRLYSENQYEHLLLTLDAEGRAVGEPRAGTYYGSIFPRDSRGLLLLASSSLDTPRFWPATIPLAFDGSPIGEPYPAVLAPAEQRAARIATDGDRLVSAWITKTAFGDRLDSATMDTRGEQRVCGPVYETDASIDGVAIAASPVGFLAVWSEEGRIRGSLLAGNTWTELPIDLPHEKPIQFWYPPTLSVDLAWDGDAFRIVWVGRSVRTALISPAGIVSDVRTIFEGGETPSGDRVIAVAARLAILPDVAVVAVATWSPYPYFNTDLPERTGAELVVIPASGTDRTYELLPIRTGVSSAPAVASNGSSAIALVSDGLTLEAVALAADGTPLHRTEIARGMGMKAVAIAPSGSGFAVSWAARADSAWVLTLFSTHLNADGSPDEPIRSVPMGTGADASVELDLAATTADATAVWTAPAGAPAHVGAYRAVTAHVSEGEVHPGVLPPPGSASIQFFPNPQGAHWPKRVEIEWTPVAGADGYLIEGMRLGQWDTFAFLPPTTHRWEWTLDPFTWTLYGLTTRFRISTMKEGLAGERLVIATRERTVRR